ncbi:hypothetical protein ACH4VX_27420 [Streptomyces sp. NPDC020731]|uniref:hypothetical protein n=1 Tax=Streptomyces sp. NPDC020731 TaxID=3365085 RepID=UPI00379AE145
MRRQLLSLLVAGAAALGLTALNAAPAQADSCASNGYATTCFTSYGDIFETVYVQSNAGSYVVFETDYGRVDTCYGEGVCNKNIREGASIKYWVCSYVRASDTDAVCEGPTYDGA